MREFEKEYYKYFDFASEVVSTVRIEAFNIESITAITIIKLRITNFIIEDQLNNTPWFLFKRKNLLKDTLLFAREERIKYVEKKELWKN